MPKVPHNLPSTIKHIFSTAACRTQVRPQALRNALRSNLSPQYVFGRPERLAPIHHGLRLSAHAHGEYGCCQDHAPRSAQVGIELLHAILYHTIAILKAGIASAAPIDIQISKPILHHPGTCLLYTSDAADDLLCVDLGGRRIIKKNNTYNTANSNHSTI